MAQSAKRPCTYMGCPELVISGRCDKHRRVEARQHDKQRGTSAQRGYGYRWQKYCKVFKHANPLCRICSGKGRVTPTEHVDHIKPVTGPNDPLFWEPTNHQPLCRDCHVYKTRFIDKKGYGAGP